MNVPALLAAARSLLDDPAEDTATVWPLGAAVLTRQAIEATLHTFWQHTVPAMLAATQSDRWVALPSYLGRTPTAAAAEHAWDALSRACHQRGYDVGLTAPELRSHLEAADAFRAVVAERLHARAVAAG